ncbi:hypothetical protein ACFE04_006922 [Oxalis oulophora]
MESPSLKLVIIKGPRDGESEFGFGSTVRIGRVIRGNNMPIKDAGISTKHLVIESDKDSKKWILTDLDSSNGTFLNQVRLTPHTPSTLNNGDILKLGEFTSIEVQIGGDEVVADDRLLKKKKATRPPKEENPKVVECLEVVKVDKPPRNPRGKNNNKKKNNDDDEEEAIDKFAESSVKQQPVLRGKGIMKSGIEVVMENSAELEQKVMEEEKMPEVVVKRGRGRPKIDGGGEVVGRVTRSRARMDKVELMDKGKVIEEVEKKKTRGGAAAGRGRGQGRKGNSRKEAVENEVVGENDRNLKIEPMEIQVVENEVECNNDGGLQKGAVEIGIVENEEECNNDGNLQKHGMQIQTVDDNQRECDSIRVEELQSDIRVEELQNDIRVDDLHSKGCEEKDNGDVKVIRDSDDEKSMASERRADGQSHEAGKKFYWEKSKVEELLDYLEVNLPKQIRENTEKMIDEMRTKAQRVNKYMIEQKMKKAKETANSHH